MSPDNLSRALVQPGRASILYLDRYSPDRPLVLECFRPHGHNPDKPVGAANSGWHTLPTSRPFLPRRARRHRADPRECRSSSWLPAGDLFRRPGHRRYDRELSEARSRDGAGAKPVYAGQFYLARGQTEAAKLGVPCRWSRVVVPGVAHEGMRMSGFAADYWFGAAGG
jgi:hypothetical protein